jgi:hypothetical protein
MAIKCVKRRQKKSAVEAMGPLLAWGVYYKSLAAQHKDSHLVYLRVANYVPNRLHFKDLFK